MSMLAIIGGTGLTALQGLDVLGRRAAATPYGAPSADLLFGRLHEREIVFLARHGNPHTIPPHRINYQANIWALKEAGASEVIAVAAVGGIRDDMAPGTLAVPDQIIDYTHGRRSSFFDQEADEVVHIDFSYPYARKIRERLLKAAQDAELRVVDGGVYGATQGPRLETAAEIRRMAQDGCALVGMTGMPEASLARELSLDYACCAVVANWAAGITPAEITMAEIEHHLSQGMKDVSQLLAQFLKA